MAEYCQFAVLCCSCSHCHAHELWVEQPGTTRLCVWKHDRFSGRRLRLDPPGRHVLWRSSRHQPSRLVRRLCQNPRYQGPDRGPRESPVPEPRHPRIAAAAGAVRAARVCKSGELRIDLQRSLALPSIILLIKCSILITYWNVFVCMKKSEPMCLVKVLSCSSAQIRINNCCGAPF